MSAVLLAAALGAASFALWLRQIAAVGRAYKAKIAGSLAFVVGRAEPADAMPEVSADSYAILRFFRHDPSLVVARPGWGVTLKNGPVKDMPALAPLPRASEPPVAVAPTKELAKVVDDAFVERDPKKPLRTRAVVLMKGGRIVAERYAPGYGPGTPLPGWSMTKSLFGALVGVLVKEGRLALAQDRLLPQWTDGRARVTLEDLLRMRSGLSFAEVYADPLSDVVTMLFRKGDCAGYAASRPLEAEPGTEWKYSSGTSNILSLVMRRAVGEDEYPLLPRRALFEPLGLSTALVEPDASGTFVASSFGFMSARDWVRLGLLQARDGMWEGRRVLPEGWVRFGSTPTPQSKDLMYGAHWWTKLMAPLGGDTPAAARIPADAFHALGHEGQCLTVIPSRDVVLARFGCSIFVDAWDHAAFCAAALDALG